MLNQKEWTIRIFLKTDMSIFYRSLKKLILLVIFCF